MRSFLQSWISCFLAAILLAACGSGTQGDLDDASQLALEVGIVSSLAGPNSLFPVQVSDSLQARLEKVGNVQMRKATYGMMSAGRMKSEGGGRLMTIELSSPVSASIEVRDGEVGLKDGDIYIGEGTKLTNADGKTFTFSRGRWSAKAGKSARSNADTIKRVTISLSQSHSNALGLADDDVTKVMADAMELYTDYKDAPDNIDELISKLEMLPIEGEGVPKNAYLSDIARIRVSQDPRGSDDTSDIALSFGYAKE